MKSVRTLRLKPLQLAQLLALVIVLLAARLAIVASRTESGWGVLSSQWSSAALGWTGWLPPHVPERAPIDQAHFWLAVVDRVIEKHVGHDAESASRDMGAAWMLDTPGDDFLHEYLGQTKHAAMGSPWALDLDDDAVAAATEPFRDATLDKCLKLAARATELEPNDPRWWRMRALLLFEPPSLVGAREEGPRTEIWHEVLDACLAHDPDNALYDYLAAATLWNESVDFKQRARDGQAGWVITDEAKFAQGTTRFLAGQTRNVLAIGEEGFPSIVEFVNESGLTKELQARVAVDRHVTSRGSMLFGRLWRSQQIRLEVGTRTGDKTEEAAIHRQCLRLFDQGILPPETSALHIQANFTLLRRTAFEALQKLSTDSPDIVPAAEFEAIREREKSLRIEAAGLIAALQDLDRDNPAKTVYSVTAIMMPAALASFLVLMAAGVIFRLFGFLLARREPPSQSLGAARQAIVWLLSSAVAFAVLGMAPAELISHHVQTRIVIYGLWGVAIAIVLGAMWWMATRVKGRKLRFRVSTLLAITVWVAVLAVVWSTLDSIMADVSPRPFKFWVPAKGWNDINAEAWREAMKIDAQSWYWASIQWFAYNGPLATIALGLALCGAWIIRRTARTHGESVLNYWTQDLRPRWGSLHKSLGLTLLYAAAWMLLLYLVLAPQQTREAEARFQHTISYCRDPRAHVAKILAAQAAVEASPSRMKPIVERVEFELSGEEFLEQDFTEDQE